IPLDDGGSIAMTPKTHIKYDWSNVKIYVSASAIGTQMSGDLKLTQDACTATYHVTGLAGNVDCDDDSGCGPANGIAATAPVMCDPDLKKCVLKDQDPF